MKALMLAGMTLPTAWHPGRDIVFCPKCGEPEMVVDGEIEEGNCRACGWQVFLDGYQIVEE